MKRAAFNERQPAKRNAAIAASLKELGFAEKAVR